MWKGGIKVWTDAGDDLQGMHKGGRMLVMTCTARESVDG